jgi:hypothetical protein
MNTDRTTDLTEVFRPSDLIGPAGVADQGQRLVDTLALSMPRELEVVLQQRENLELGRRRGTRLERSNWGKIAKAAGLGDTKLADVSVRGGADEDGNNVDSEAAWVTFVYFDDRGDTLKGAVPFLDVAEEPSGDEPAKLKSSPSGDGVILQSEALAKSPAARDHAEAQAKARAAEEASAEASGPSVPDLATARASEIVAYMEENPDAVDGVKAFEEATQDKPRKTIMEYEPPSDDGGSGDGGGGDPGDETQGGQSGSPDTGQEQGQGAGQGSGGSS